MFDSYSSDQKRRAAGESTSGSGRPLPMITAPLRDRPSMYVISGVLVALTASVLFVSGNLSILFLIALGWVIAAILLTFRLLSLVADVKIGRFSSNAIGQRAILAVAVTAVSFGPFLVAATVGSYMVLNSLAAERAVFNKQIERLPGTPYYTGRRVDEQSKAVNETIRDVRPKTSENGELVLPPVLTSESQDGISISEVPPTRAFGPTDFIGRFLSLPAPVTASTLIFFVSGIILFPAAVLVAAQTGSIRETTSPLVILEKVMSNGYRALSLRCLGAALLAAIASIAAVVAVSIVESPELASQFALLWVSGIAFYTFAVIATMTRSSIHEIARTAPSIR
jgi:hypothetical protein